MNADSKKAAGAKVSREERAAEALRENIRRRKRQAEMREAEGIDKKASGHVSGS